MNTEVFTPSEYLADSRLSTINVLVLSIIDNQLTNKSRVNLPNNELANLCSLDEFEVINSLKTLKYFGFIRIISIGKIQWILREKAAPPPDFLIQEKIIKFLEENEVISKLTTDYINKITVIFESLKIISKRSSFIERTIVLPLLSYLFNKGFSKPLEENLENSENKKEVKKPTENQPLSKRERLRSPTTKEKKKLVTTSRQVRYMIQYWNEKSKENNNLPRKLNEMHGGNQTKTFVNAVKYCLEFLSGKLYQVGGSGTVPGKLLTDRSWVVPFTFEDWKIFVDRFVVVLHDGGVYPRRKDYIREKANITDFLVGNPFGNFSSFLLEHCYTEPVLIYNVVFPQFIPAVLKSWETIHGKKFQMSPRDEETFDRFLRWMIPFFEKEGVPQEKIRSMIYPSITQCVMTTWKKRKPSITYLTSKSFQENYSEFFAENFQFFGPKPPKYNIDGIDKIRRPKH